VRHVLLVALLLLGSVLPCSAEPTTAPTHGTKITYESMWFTVKNQWGVQLNEIDMARIIRDKARQGWQPVYPYLEAPGYPDKRLLLLFVRIAMVRNGAFVGFLPLGTYYWDWSGNCARHRSTGKPAAGSFCKNRIQG
jgi:hypothetical protein